MSEKKNVFLTGATGFIGAYLLTEMLKSSHIGKIYTLCRRFDPQNDRDRILLSFKKFSIEMDRAYLFTDQIQVVEGDITMPRFGLSELHLRNDMSGSRSYPSCRRAGESHSALSIAQETQCR
ncbi:SDR family oxidoreductase [Agrobacterium vitis]|uniref:SDR family oxidoreductase n=1 Tax=Agrobacterium vitis TaxID=373 RepID=UPI002352367C|nr:SDR family oxidoreductase [Agrobacterium vitis]